MMNSIGWFVKEHPVIQDIYTRLGSVFMRAWGRCIKLKENRILFTSYNGKGYNDSPKVVYEYMLEHCRDYDFEYVWAFEDPSKYSNLAQLKNCTLVKIDTPSYFRIALSSKYWVTNVNIERALKFKKPDTIYLNTYHGIAMKKDGLGAGHAYADYSRVNILCSDGMFHRSRLIKDYKANPDSILLCGRPREDTLWSYNADEAEECKRRLGLPNDKAVILYAPTWRELDSAKKEPPIDFKKWEEKLSDNYVVLYRSHHYARNARNNEYDSFLFDGTKEEDINIEYKAADILISDYSAVFGDYSILEKPMLCFAFDYEEYKSMRGFNIDPKEVFAIIYYDEDSLLEHLIMGDFEINRSDAIRFKHNYMEFGGQATQQCVDALLEQSELLKK